ncbi:hypothetical protein GGI12_003604 [Dipsacomyces acuminosporus]|nr:hypothetical protein GGI12_003604 [Dipsacomyces acuminosporus]
MISDNTPYTTPELEVRELGPLDPPVHNAKAKHSPPPETPLPVPPLRATAAAPLDASAKKTAQSTGASDSEQKLQQPASSPMLLSRKSTILNTAPRVPSTLRKVVDVGSTEAKAEDGDKASALGIQHAASSAIHNEQAASGRTPPQSTSSLPPLLSPRMSTPALRKNLNEPTIMNLVDRSNTDSSSLPHPHDFEGYPLRPRPRSLNTLSGMSCRLSIITVDQEYEEFSYKKNAQQPVRPSLVRGWIRRLGGKVKVG